MFVLIRSVVFVLFFFSTANANSIVSKYDIKTSGIKIGFFNWELKVKDRKYESKISLKSSGLLSYLNKFEGNYISKGIFENNYYKAQQYKQVWQTKNKTKIVEMRFGSKLLNLVQEPTENEFSRINLDILFDYYDPITSFINILNGETIVRTVDGRRIYLMEKVALDDSKNITVKIKDYKNIWADHKRNDLSKIEFFLINDQFLPEKINIYFKERVFRLSKI